MSLHRRWCAPPSMRERSSRCRRVSSMRRFPFLLATAAWCLSQSGACVLPRTSIWWPSPSRQGNRRETRLRGKFSVGYQRDKDFCQCPSLSDRRACAIIPTTPCVPRRSRRSSERVSGRLVAISLLHLCRHFCIVPCRGENGRQDWPAVFRPLLSGG